VFAKMDIAFYSDEAKLINIKIFETLYHAAVEKSCELSQNRSDAIKALVTTYKKMWRFLDDDPSCRQYITEDGLRDMEGYEVTIEYLDKYRPVKNEILQCRDSISLFPNCAGAYSSFAGSPASHGFLQFDLWNVQPNSRYNWDALKQKIKQYGLRNSLLMAPMPTASTSQILGNNECFEPFTSNIYTRRTLAGEFIRINKYLISELSALGLWNEDIKNSIIEHKGSIQQLKNIPENIREKFKIVWEIPMKFIIEMARDRGAYICQSQSLNLWMKDPNYKSLTAMHFFSWKQGLKTGLYYLRSRAKASPQQFTIAPKNDKIEVDNEPPQCEMCSG